MRHQLAGGEVSDVGSVGLVQLSAPSKRHAIADENIDTAQVHIEV
eukprot:COSAG06_NODE_35749_length_456_cov_0.722689_1_plen_44_part_10